MEYRIKNPEPVEISVVVPVFNEEGNLPILISKLVQVLNPLGLSYEVIFVDDGSSDGSRKILKEMVSRYPFFR
ncbi:MAG: glycosyltransferase, partial [Thermodesulfobacteriota bacterium]|nr:glycosyltransferase [Thermodesulfobacteriota bacterium]